MKEFVVWVIPTLIIFGFIMILESVILFEKSGEEVSSFQREKENL